MKWFTHQSVALGTALCLNLSPLTVAAVWSGAVLPDVIDQRLAGSGPGSRRRFNKIHRGLSHWFGWYFLLMLLPFLVPPTVLNEILQNLLGSKADMTKQIQALFLGLGFGGFLHIALDMLTPSGVPIMPHKPKKRFSLNLLSTGSFKEYIFLALCIVAFFFLAPEKIHTLLQKIV